MSEDGESLMSSIIKEVSVLKDRLKIKDEDEIYNPFEGIQKSEVLQECKKFNDSKFVTQQPRRCCIIITQLLFLVHHGEVFTERETTEVFFGVTKLFQSKNAQLRRMMYLFIKHLAEITREEEVIIVVASLVKDMTSNDPLNKANSIRVLSRIVTGGLLGNIEKYITQAIVAKDPMVASAALVAGLTWLPKNREIVTRWGSQVSAAVSTCDDMVQYHALALLYEMRKSDKLAVSKIITKHARGVPFSTLGACLLVQFTKTLLLSQSTSQESIVTACYDYLDACMRHQSEFVIYEAARAVCELQGIVPDTKLRTAVTVLHMFLTSIKPTLRFAAVRCLNKVAMRAPQEVVKCNDDMESLIVDGNRSIATLAITTLLKTGNEASIERLMKQISTFMGDIPDEFKVVVVEAIQALCIKYPRKHPLLLSFLSFSLRDEGSATYKKAIVDAIIYVMQQLPQCRDSALLHLCEFIEDCEFVDLSVSVLGVLGREVPRTAQPSKYIRFIFNRVILEKPMVRAAAVTNLAKLGLAVPTLATSIVALLRRCLLDDDDEVRDRATMYIQLLNQKVASLKTGAGANAIAPEDKLQDCYERVLPFSISRLARSLEAYKLAPTDGPLTIDSLPVVEEVVSPRKKSDDDDDDVADDDANKALSDAGATAAQEAHALYNIAEFASFGALIKSTKPQPLGEAEAEYVVQCTTHVFASHVVFQFDIRNTVEDQLLEDVWVDCEVTSGEEQWQLDDEPIHIKAPAAAFGKRAVSYTALARNADIVVSEPSTLEACLHFVLKDVDPEDGTVDEFAEGENEEWDLEPITVSPIAFMVPAAVDQFDRVWTSLGDSAETSRAKFNLDVPDIATTLAKVIAASGMAPCEGSHMPDDGARAHMFMLSGVYCGKSKVLVRAQLLVGAQKGGVGGALKVMVRATGSGVAELVMNHLTPR